MTSKYDYDWTDYVLDKLKKDELTDKNPTCQGLLRVCEEVYGRITSIETEVIKAPGVKDPSATVAATIQCIEYSKDKKGEPLRSRTDLENGVVIHATGTSDSHKEYLKQPFDQHLVSTLETRAIGRAIKRILNLRCLTSEENEYNDIHREKVKSSQITTIKNMCKVNNIDMGKLLVVTNQISEEQLPKTSKEVAAKIIDVLNGYQNGEVKIPKEILLV